MAYQSRVAPYSGERVVADDERRNRSSYSSCMARSIRRSGGPPPRLRSAPYRTVEIGVIAPPLTNKTGREPAVQGHLEQGDGQQLGACAAWIIIGYSLPDGDGLEERSRYRLVLTWKTSSSSTRVPRSRRSMLDLFTRVAPRARGAHLSYIRPTGDYVEELGPGDLRTGRCWVQGVDLVTSVGVCRATRSR